MSLGPPLPPPSFLQVNVLLTGLQLRGVKQRKQANELWDALVEERGKLESFQVWLKGGRADG